MTARGVDRPRSTVISGFTLISFLAVPYFLFAGLRFERDRARLYKDVDEGHLPSQPQLSR